MSRWLAVMTALFVTFLWSTSYILNRMAFAQGVGPMTLAGLRYTLAAATLGLVRLIYQSRTDPVHLREHGNSPRLPELVGLGVSGYLVAQGFQYIGQYYVTPTQAGMVLSVGNTLLVLLVGVLWLKETPVLRQGVGMTIALLGTSLYYYPWSLTGDDLRGVGMLVLSGLGYALHLTATRALLTRRSVLPMDLVLLPMAVGAMGMLGLGLWLEPMPSPSLSLAILLLWLGPVNGALAFLLWTLTQKALRAYESSIMNNSMLVQIALLDVCFLGRALSMHELAGLIASGLGIMITQMAARNE